MRRWDLHSGASKLDLALESLRLADAEATHHWDDITHQEFQEKYLEPLEPRLKRAAEAVQRLAEVVARAQRECEEG
jgi:hypothetical protein